MLLRIRWGIVDPREGTKGYENYEPGASGFFFQTINDAVNSSFFYGDS